jgi:hypothetical protein
LSKIFIPDSTAVASSSAQANKLFNLVSKYSFPAFAPLIKASITDTTTCFTYNKPDYMAVNCPQKKMTPEFKKIIDESDIESESEKDSI